MTRVYFAVLAVVTVLVVIAFWRVTPDRPFFYDESDYMYAGSQGFVNNYLDLPSITTIEFVKQGLALARDKGHRGGASQFIRGAGDITFYRHYHGPVYAYWIAFCKAIGFESPGSFRASGLLIHAMLVALIFGAFRLCFPEYPPVAAFAAGLAFVFNRTALAAATFITQHVIFGLTAALTLLPLSLFCRTGEKKYWYITAAALGVAFATVETSFILVVAVLFVLTINALRTGWKPALRLFGRGLLIFVLAILVVWPKGVLALGGFKGYMYLAYMAVIRKTFTPISPIALWGFKFSTYPEEFVLPFLCLIAATVFWKKLAARDAAIPWLVYSWTFFLITMVITLPYTYYHDSLMMTCSVVVGIAFGELWRQNAAVKATVSVVFLASLLYMSVRFHGELKRTHDANDPRIELLSYLKTQDRSVKLYVPFVLVPTLHYYYPDMNLVGYQPDWDAGTLASQMRDAGRAELLCEEAMCRSVAGLSSGLTGPNPVMGADADLEQKPLYSFVPDPALTR